MFKRKIRIFAISDLHLGFKLNKSMEVFGDEWKDYLSIIKSDWKKSVKKNDIVLIPGDISWAMKTGDVLPDIEWISELPGRKVMIRGNHDYWWSSRTAVRKILKNDMYIIDNDSLQLNGYVFCGTRGWTVPERRNTQVDSEKKIFEREVRRLEMSVRDAFKKESVNKIIGMIHYPPFNTSMDDSEFTKIFEKYGIEKVVYGHIHGKNSKAIMEYKKNGITYYLTSCDKLGHKLKRII